MFPVSGNLDYLSYSEPEDRSLKLEDVRWDHGRSVTDGGHPSLWTSSSSGPNTHLESRASSSIPLQSFLAIVGDDEVPHQGYSGWDNGFESSNSDFGARKCLEYVPEQDNTSNRLNIASSSSAGSPTATPSSSSVIASTRGIKRSREEGEIHPEDLIDIYGDRQIVKPSRTDGRLQCPYSRCSAHFTRTRDRNRHLQSEFHLNTLRCACPVPYCLFEGARSDVVSRHQRQRVHGYNELGQCTCDAKVCKRARNQSKRARKE